MSQVHNPNQVFLNLAAANTTPQTQTGCEFTDDRTRDVLQDTGAYNVALVNFSLPSAQIGLQKQANDGTRTVTIVHTASGDVYTSEILWLDTRATGAASGWVYHADEIITATNNAFVAALNALNIDHAGPAFADAPEISIEGGKCVIYFPAAMMSFAGLHVSAATERLFSGVATTLLSVPLSPTNTATQLAQQYKYEFVARASNVVTLRTIDFIRSEQQKQTVSSWWTPRQLLVGIHGISVGGELMPAGDTGGSAESLLTNFHLDGSSNLSGGDLIFYQQGPHRWYALGDSTGVRSTAARVYLETPDGDREPLQLAYGDTAAIRLLFRRSELGLA